MDEGIFDLFARGLFGIFKRRPVIAFILTISIMIVALSIWIINAQTPDDRVFPVIGLVFVFFAVVGRIVAFIRQRVLHDIQAEIEDQADESSPLLHKTHTD